MNSAYVSLIAGFVGVVIGTVGSICAVWLQQRFQSRDNRARLIVETAIEAYRSAERYAEFMFKHGKSTVSPELAYYIILHTKLLEALSSGTAVTADQWVQAHREANAVQDAIRALYSADHGE